MPGGAIDHPGGLAHKKSTEANLGWIFLAGRRQKRRGIPSSIGGSHTGAIAYVFGDDQGGGAAEPQLFSPTVTCLFSAGENFIS